MERDLWIIIEYCPHGNLLEFLRKRRDIFEATWTTPTEHADVTFTTIDLYICALQAARAMDFLASRRVRQFLLSFGETRTFANQNSYQCLSHCIFRVLLNIVLTQPSADRDNSTGLANS